MIRKKRMDEIMHSKATLGGTSAFYQEKYEKWLTVTNKGKRMEKVEEPTRYP